MDLFVTSHGALFLNTVHWKPVLI